MAFCSVFEIEHVRHIITLSKALGKETCGRWSLFKKRAFQGLQGPCESLLDSVGRWKKNRCDMLPRPALMSISYQASIDLISKSIVSLVACGLLTTCPFLCIFFDARYLVPTPNSFVAHLSCDEELLPAIIG